MSYANRNRNREPDEGKLSRPDRKTSTQGNLVLSLTIK